MVWGKRRRLGASVGGGMPGRLKSLPQNLELKYCPVIDCSS